MCPQFDLVSQLVPVHERTSCSVFVAPEDEVFPKTAEIDHTTTLFLRDSDQLQAFLDERSGRLNPKVPNARNGILTRLLLNATFKIGVADVNLGNAVFTPNLSRNLETYDQYVVYENGVTSGQFAELFQLYMATPAHRRPCVLLISNQNESRLIEKLSYSRDTIEFVDVSKPNDRVINVKRLAPTQTNDYLDLYCRGVYHSAARTKLVTLLTEGDNSSDPVRTLMANVLQFQARLMTEERHHVEPDVDAVLADLDLGTDAFTDEQRDEWLRLKCYLLLQKTYCSEQKKPLEQALAIATVLGNEFDNALCMRYAHFLDQEPALEKHMLARAERTFRENDCLELALYAANNLAVVDFTSSSEISDSFSQLCQEIDERIPGLHRKFDIEYNGAVQALFARRLDKAQMMLQSISKSNARPLIKCSADLCSILIHKLADRPVELGPLIELLTHIRDEVDPSNKWHRCNLALNALVLAKDAGLNWKLIHKNYEDLVSLSTALDVRDIYDENARLAKQLGLVEDAPSEEIGGSFGRLFKETNCLIPFYFIWS